MLIGVISDTHGNKLSIEAGVKAAGNVDEWLHLGDFAKDAEYLRNYTGLPTDAVRGNCDAFSLTPLELVKTVDGVKIMLTHGHAYDVNSSLNRLLYRANELSCQIALYGHTHMPYMERQGGVLILNPGSAYRPIGCKKPSVAVLSIESGNIQAEIKTIE